MGSAIIFFLHLKLLPIDNLLIHVTHQLNFCFDNGHLLSVSIDKINLSAPVQLLRKMFQSLTLGDRDDSDDVPLLFSPLSECPMSHSIQVKYQIFLNFLQNLFSCVLHPFN